MQAIGTTAHSLLPSTIVPELHATGTVLRRNNLLVIRGNLESILSELPTANAMQGFFFFFCITVQYKARDNLANKLVLWKIGDREVDRFNSCHHIVYPLFSNLVKSNRITCELLKSTADSPLPSEV